MNKIIQTMRTKILHLTVGLLALLGPHSAFAQGTAFTYQGQLTSADLPANGSYDLAFSLYTTASGGSPLAGPLTNSATAISNGLFTVTLDFGANFPGTARWLEISVRTNGGSGFATLSPRQALAPTPYAIYAGGASAAGISGTLGGAQIPSLDASKITTGTFSAAQIPTLDAGTKLTGTLADAQLSANVAMLNREVQTFTGGTNSFSGNVGIGTTAPQAKLHLSGGNLKLTGGSVNLDSGKELFFADQGQIRSVDDHHRILFRRLENKLEF